MKSSIDTNAMTISTSSTNELFDYISKRNDVSEFCVNTMNMPMKENNLYTCVRTTIRMGNMTISMDGYADSSSASSDNPCVVTDNAKANSISEVMNILRCTTDNNMDNSDEVIDVMPINNNFYITVPENFKRGKYLEHRTDGQIKKLYYTAMKLDMTPDELTQKTLGKSTDELTKGEAALLILSNDK
jgi:hypothetical protein